jgi:hypothetical protein
MFGQKRLLLFAPAVPLLLAFASALAAQDLPLIPPLTGGSPRRGPFTGTIARIDLDRRLVFLEGVPLSGKEAGIARPVKGRLVGKGAPRVAPVLEFTVMRDSNIKVDGEVANFRDLKVGMRARIYPALRRTEVPPGTNRVGPLGEGATEGSTNERLYELAGPRGEGLDRPIRVARQRMTNRIAAFSARPPKPKGPGLRTP